MTPEPSRSAYHHGDLRNALAAAAAVLAEQGGPDAVTIRAAAREVGVTPTAAYRHFTGHDDLLLAAKEQSMARMGVAMRLRLDSLPSELDEVDAAIARLEAMGRGYVDFALSEPGLFRTAFCRGEPAAGTKRAHWDPLERFPEDEADSPHAMLVGMIDELVGAGFLTEQQRLGAQMGAWSLVHGLAMLLIDGPLVSLPEPERAVVVEETMVGFTQTFWNARKARSGEVMP